MNLTIKLSLICILFEIWHLFYYSYYYDKKLKYTYKVYGWAKSFKDLYITVLKFSNEYKNNIELQYKLRFNEQMAKLDEIFNEPSYGIVGSNKVLTLCTVKQLCTMFIVSVLEVIYWTIIGILALSLPKKQCIVLIGTMLILSKLQSILNKNNDKIYHILDSIACIIIFMIIIYKFR